MNKTNRPTVRQTAVILGLIASTPLFGANKTWDATGTGGQLGTALNWTDDITPSAGDDLFFNNTTANRRANHNSASLNNFNSINFTQTSAFSNAFEIRNRLTVTNTINLSASDGGQVNMRILSYNGSAPTNFSTVTSGTMLTGSVVVGSNGSLTFSRFIAAASGSMPTYLNGDVTVNSGGSLIIDRLYRPVGSASTNSSSLTYVLNGAVSMSTGSTLSIAPDNTSIADAAQTGGDTETADTRLQINGNFTATGGSITSGNTGAADLSLVGATNSILSSANLNTTDLTLTSTVDGNNQSLTSGAALNGLAVIGFGNSVKTVSATNTVGNIIFRQNGTSGKLTFKLGANLELKSGSSISVGSLGNGTTQDLTIDTNGFALNASAGSVNFNNSAAARASDWTVTGGGSLSAGSIAFNATSNPTLPDLTVTAGTAITATTFDATNVGTITLGVDSLANFASIQATTQTFAGSLVINLGATPAVGTYQLFGASGGAGDFSSIAITSFEPAILTGSNVWTGASSNFLYSFSELNGVLTVASSAIPEPGTFAALAGLAGLACAATRRRRA